MVITVRIRHSLHVFLDDGVQPPRCLDCVSQRGAGNHRPFGRCPALHCAPKEQVRARSGRLVHCSQSHTCLLHDHNCWLL